MGPREISEFDLLHLHLTILGKRKKVENGTASTKYRIMNHILRHEKNTNQKY